MYTAAVSRVSQDRTSTGQTLANAAVSPMARYAYPVELGEQVRDALAARVFVLSDAVAVMRLVQSH